MTKPVSKRRWISWSLRGFLATAVVFAIVAGLVGRQYRRAKLQHELVEMAAADAKLAFDDDRLLRADILLNDFVDYEMSGLTRWPIGLSQPKKPRGALAEYCADALPYGE